MGHCTVTHDPSIQNVWPIWPIDPWPIDPFIVSSELHGASTMVNSSNSYKYVIHKINSGQANKLWQSFQLNKCYITDLPF